MNDPFGWIGPGKKPPRDPYRTAEEKLARIIMMVGVVLGLLLATLLGVTVTVIRAYAHSDIDHRGVANHFDHWCCDGKDCLPTSDEDLEELAGGNVRHLPSGKVFGPSPTRILPSQNSKQYVCIYNGEPRCLYRRFGT